MLLFIVGFVNLLKWCQSVGDIWKRIAAKVIQKLNVKAFLKYRTLYDNYADNYKEKLFHNANVAKLKKSVTIVSGMKNAVWCSPSQSIILLLENL